MLRRVLTVRSQPQRRWCSKFVAWKGKQYEDMTNEELEAAETYESKRWIRKKWPFVVLAAGLIFLWIPEYTKFYWHLRLQFLVHEMYWKMMLPKEEADSLIKEKLLGVPPERRSVQNPLAACPIRETDPNQFKEAQLRGLPQGHPGADRRPQQDGPNPFAMGIVQAIDDLKNTKPS